MRAESTCVNPGGVDVFMGYDDEITILHNIHTRPFAAAQPLIRLLLNLEF